jgi:hypothetical protein
MFANSGEVAQPWAEVPQLLPDSIAEEPEAHHVGVTYLTF